MLISDLETLKVVADPLRLSILEYLMRPGTVKRIAEKLNKPATKLYYHFNLLEKHGLIQLVDTQVVSGIIEKHYQAAARTYYVDRDLLSPGSDEGVEGLELTLNSLFADSKNDVMQSIRDGIIKGPGGRDVQNPYKLIIGQSRLHLTEEQALDFQEKLHNLMKEFMDISRENEDNDDINVYKMLIVQHPTSRTMHTHHEEINIGEDILQDDPINET